MSGIANGRPVADQLCTPSDLACFMQDDADTYTATLCIEVATAVVQSLVGQRIVGDYPPGAQELELARAVTVTLARDAYEDPKGSKAVSDYERAYRIAVAEMEASPHLQAALKLQYERRVALIVGWDRYRSCRVCGAKMRQPCTVRTGRRVDGVDVSVPADAPHATRQLRVGAR